MRWHLGTDKAGVRREGVNLRTVAVTARHRNAAMSEALTACSLLNLGQGHLECGIDPLQDLPAAHKVGRVHHPNAGAACHGCH